MAVPYTLLAHQAPVLPLAGRRHADGLALVVGTFLPDLMGVTSGWGYAGGGVPLYLDGHRVQNQLVVALVAVVVTAIVRATVVPVLPRLVGRRVATALAPLVAPPAAGPRRLLTFASALLGGLTHLVLDALTHEQGRAIWWLQAGVSAALAAATLWWVRNRLRAVAPGGPGPEARAVAVVTGALVAGVALGTVWGATRVGWSDYYGTPIRISVATGVMTVAWVSLAAVVAACGMLRRRGLRPLRAERA